VLSGVDKALAAIAEAAGSPGSGRKVANMASGPEGAATEEKTPAWAKALIDEIAALADASNAHLGLISDELTQANERGTQRSPLVVLPPRGSDLVFASRSQLLAQRRPATSRAANFGGNARTL